MQNNLALIAKYFKKLYKPTNNNLKTSSISRNKNVDTTLSWETCRPQSGSAATGRHVFNCKEFGHFTKECRKPKRVKDSMYHKENMLLCKQVEKGVSLQAEQSNWLADTDDEIDEQELEAHYSFMTKIQEVPTADSRTDVEPLEQVDSNVIPDLPYMCDNNIQTDQNAVECNDERVALANLIANLKLDVDDNKKIQKQLNKANTTLAHELTECKSILAKTSRTLRESNISKSISKSRQAYNVMTNNINHLRELVDQAWVKHSRDHFCAPTAKYMEILIKACFMPLSLKTQNDSFAFVHELKQEMHADLKYVESLENEIDELESDKAEFSNMYDMLLQECVSNDVMCSYLHSLSDLDAHTELQCLYLHKVKECECLAQKLSKQTEFVSKEVYTELLRSFAKLEKHSISLELALQQCQEQMKNDTVCKEKASNVFLKEREQYFEIQDLKAQLQDKNIAISELKKLIEKCKGKYVETKFDKPSVVRQPNAQRIPKPSVLGKPAPFSDSFERKSFSQTKLVPKTNVSEGLSKPVTTQILPQIATQVVRNTNVIKPGMYRINTRTTQTRAPQLPQTSRNTNPRVSTSIGVIHRTNVSRPQLRSTQMKDKVVPNNSHVKNKKTKVEDHHKISSISNKTKFVTASTDSLKSQTLNVNVVCATCGKCVFNSNHDACVSKYLNDVNARTKKPKVVPISTRKPKSQVNKSVATPHKKTVALESTTQKSKSYHRMLYEKTSTVRFGNDHLAPTLGYGDLVQGNITINGVYYVEGLNHNLFSVGQFCDADLEVAFWKSTCFIRDLQGNDLLTGNRRSDLYIISLQETTSSTPICLMAKASPTQAWLWHRRRSHLNFDYINLLLKKDVVIGLPKLKYVKDQLCSSCEVSKAKRSSFKTKAVPSSKGRLNLLYMDLCGPMQVASINGKKYILVIVDDYSRYTWTLFLRSKDETPEVLKDFLTMI
ncbi:retrovirus-related pol polyprotein from transposon TNT 1-94 [Tanacetum coccineum]